MTNNLPEKPKLSDIIEDFISKALSNTFCALPGRIESYDPAKSTAEVSVGVKRAINDITGATTDYPLLTDVPVFRLTGGTAGVNIPIVKGDPCLLIFSDRNIDNWYATGSAQKPNSRRIHSIADGFAMVGFRPLTNPATGPDYEATSLYDGTTQVSIKNGKAAIKNATTDIKTLIDLLKTAINSAFSGATVTVTDTGSGAPQTVGLSYSFTPPDFGGLLYEGDDELP